MTTFPMVALMRVRGHAWRPCWEMSLSMYLPALLAIALVQAGAMRYMPAMALEHAVMFPAMPVAMLLRPAECTGHAHASPAHDDAARPAVEVAS